MNFDNLIVKQETREYEKIKPGLINAICVGVWNIGKQKIEFQGEVKFKTQVIIGFEVQQRHSEKDEPMLQLSKFNMSLHEKSKLGPMIESWFSKKLTDSERYNYDLKQIIGKKCTLNLIENGNYINIATILPPQESNKLVSEDVLKGELPNFVKTMREKAVKEDEQPSVNVDEIVPVLPKKEAKKKEQVELSEKTPF
jgi:hypothetical protein